MFNPWTRRPTMSASVYNSFSKEKKKNGFINIKRKIREVRMRRDI